MFVFTFHLHSSNFAIFGQDELASILGKSRISLFRPQNVLLFHHLIVPSHRRRFSFGRVLIADVRPLALAALDFSDAATRIYSFFLYDLCDSYIELVKIPLADAAKFGPEVSPELAASCRGKLDILWTALDSSFKLLHPFMPFVTEELWQRLPKPSNYAAALVIAPYPEETDFHQWDSPQIADCILVFWMNSQSFTSCAPKRFLNFSLCNNRW